MPTVDGTISSMNNPKMRDLEWVGASLKDLRAFPSEVRRAMGFALKIAQDGGKHPNAKPLKGYHGAGVLEIIEDDDGDTYRAMYTVSFPDAVYVLHAFKKKSTQGRATPKRELDVLQERLKVARRISSERRQRGEKKLLMSHVNDSTPSSGNVFADLGFDDPEAEMAKAELALVLSRAIVRQGWTLPAAARALDIKPEKVAAIHRGRLGRISLQTLIHLVTRLNFDVEIKISPNSSSGRNARFVVDASRIPEIGQARPLEVFSSVGMPAYEEEAS